MALARHALVTLAPHMKGAKILSLGYPDILATQEECREIFGVDPRGTINAGAQHNVQRPLVETMELVKLLGSTLDCIDVYKWRGFEMVLDLNEPTGLGRYDLVIDPGTTEHCFNVGQAIMNAANAVRVGGRIYHSPPLVMLNHGFWNFSFTALQDFYKQNGWKIELYEVRAPGADKAAPVSEDVAVSRNNKIPTAEMGLVFMAQRLTAAELRWPTQRKYLLMREAKAA